MAHARALVAPSLCIFHTAFIRRPTVLSAQRGNPGPEGCTNRSTHDQVLLLLSLLSLREGVARGRRRGLRRGAGSLTTRHTMPGTAVSTLTDSDIRPFSPPSASHPNRLRLVIAAAPAPEPPRGRLRRSLGLQLHDAYATLSLPAGRAAVFSITLARTADEATCACGVGPSQFHPRSPEITSDHRRFRRPPPQRGIGPSRLATSTLVRSLPPTSPPRPHSPRDLETPTRV